MEQRVQKLISDSGLMSRRKAELLIAAGRVRVNGNTARLGDTADLQEDIIEVDGVRLKKSPGKVCLMLHKPRGFVTTLSDEKGRKTVANLLTDCPVRVYPVGRLDYNSEGLLLLTNDGELANRLMHPRNGVEKEYMLWVTGFYDGAEQKLCRAVTIDGYRIQPPEVKLCSRNEQSARLTVTIHEGRNRQIRKMCQLAGLHVTRLCRIREGNLCLGDLPKGKWRYLLPQEMEQLCKI